jgi:hypothetical protein
MHLAERQFLIVGQTLNKEKSPTETKSLEIQECVVSEVDSEHFIL